jgi:hypothetical protein
LETAQFAKFWQDAKIGKELLKTIPGFDDAIRKCELGKANRRKEREKKEKKERG